MGKRANVKPATSGAAKKGKVDPTFASVSDAVMEADHLPDRVRAMLVEMMPFSLKAASDERHDLQSMAVDMVDQTLNSKKNALEAFAAAEEAALAALQASESTLGATVDATEAALASAKNGVEATANALDDATASAKASAGALETQHKLAKSAKEELATMQEEKTAIESAFAEHFKPMEEGEGKGHLKKLEPFLKKIEIESTLLTALPSSVAKAKDKRGTFDHLVLQELEKAFNAKITALGADVAAGALGATNQEAAIGPAEQKNSELQAAQTQAAAQSEAAVKNHSDREAALSAAKQAVEEFGPQLEERTKALSDARTASAEFEAGPFANFLNFKTRVAAAPEEAAPAEEAEAEMDKDAPAAA